jgi:hypothetical protein
MLKSCARFGDRLVEDRRGLTEALAKPYDRGNTENWRVHLVEVQQTIAAIDEAIKEWNYTVSWLRGRRGLPPRSDDHAPLSPKHIERLDFAWRAAQQHPSSLIAKRSLLETFLISLERLELMGGDDEL